MKSVKGVTLLYPLYWGMDTLYQSSEDFSDQLQHLLSNASRQEQEEKIESFLQEARSGFARVLDIVKETLTIVERRLEERSITPDELREKHDSRFSEKLPDLNSIMTRQKLQELDGASKFLALFDQIEGLKQDIVLYDSKIGELILTAWRKEHPYFSSMGILDTAIDVSSGREVQSDTLKDFKALDRR